MQHIQISIWGSQELCSEIMGSFQERKGFKSKLARESGLDSPDLSPCQHFNKGMQYGCITPKLLTFLNLDEKYIDKDTESELDIRIADYEKDLVDVNSELYLSSDYGFRQRAAEKGDIFVYPALRVDSKDYLITYNVIISIEDENIIRLLAAQLEKLSSSHCYMTQLRAFNDSKDVCYQSVRVKSADSLIDNDIAETGYSNDSCWFGETTSVYCIDSLALPADEERENIPVEDAVQYVRDGDLDEDVLLDLEVTHLTKWNELFNDKYHSITYDLFYLDKDTTVRYITTTKEPVLIDFDWIA